MDNSRKYSREELVLFKRSGDDSIKGSATRGSATAIVILGPPGSGKTTLASAFARPLKQALTYIEDTQANPVLAASRNFKEVDLGESQKWFFHQYDKVLGLYRGQKSLIIDQDPRAVALVYSRTFMSRGWLESSIYNRHLQACRTVLKRLDSLTSRYLYVLLLAPRDVLLERIADRDLQGILKGQLGQEILGNFDLLFSTLKTADLNSCVDFDTSQTTIQEMISRLKLISGKLHSGHNE